MNPLIYIVEDEATIQELYSCALEGAQMDAVCFFAAKEMYDALSKKKPDLFILDIMLDGMDGYEILKDLRSDPRYSNIPVIMVSAKGEELNKVKGLNLGADDYMSKPFGVLELVARIKANIRKAVRKREDLKYHDIFVEDSVHVIKIGQEEMDLTLKEYNLLRLFVENAGNVLTRDEILRIVWGTDFLGETRTVDMHIKELRKKMAACKSISKIETIRGVGYILK